MQKKRSLAFLMAVCLALTPVMSASASSAEGIIGGALPTEAASETNPETVPETNPETDPETNPETAPETDPENGIVTLSGNEPVAGGDPFTEDFESADADWGMTGTLVSEGKLSIATDETGNKYLAMNGTSYSTRTATKVFDVPGMTAAEVSFKWYTTSLTSESSQGRPGITLKSGDVEIVSVYMGENRGGAAATAPVYYSAYGSGITQISGKTVNKGINTVHISVDFEELKAVVTINDTEYVTVDVNAMASKVDTLMLNMAGDLGSGRTYTVNMGIDDFSLSFTEGEVVRAPHIVSLEALEPVTAVKTDYEKGFAHYTQVTATLSDDTTVTMDIDPDSWTSEPAEFNPDEWGEYIWRADVKLPDDGSITNPGDVRAEYSMTYMADFLPSDIASVKMPEVVNVTQEEWISGAYQHPQLVAATLNDGSVITVYIDQSSWTSTPEFDVNSSKTVYTWTADLMETEGHRNPNNCTVTYTMNYYGTYVSEHDYENDFSFGIIDWKVWGREVDSGSWSGGYTFEIKKDGDNAYLQGTVSNNNKRGSRVDLPNDIVKGATIEFDWKPVTVNGGSTNISFVSPAIWQNYFTISVDSTGAIKYYTEPDYADSNSSKPADCNGFTGEITAARAVSTGVTDAIGNWYTFKLDFDYIGHTAAFTVTKKGDAQPAYTLADIPIFSQANGLSSMVMRKPNGCSSSTNALDNIFVDYTRFDAGDIVDVTQPENINLTRDQYRAGYELPKEVTVILGDGSKVKLPVAPDSWTSTPAFDENTANDYVWTAPLVTDQYTNLFDLSIEFSMHYTLMPYVTGVNNPATLELEYGKDGWDGALPTTATVILSTTETVTDAPISEWTPIREFNASEEGIYVYGAKLADDDRYVVDRSLKEYGLANEFHGAQAGAIGELMTYDEELYDYDVFYRISYFASNTHYNEYTRSMEYLNRGITAVPAGNGILVSWRLRVEEYGTGIQFNVLRNGEKVNSSPIDSKTNYLDEGGKPGDVYSIQVVKDGIGITENDTATALSDTYMSIPLQRPDPQPDKDGNMNSYTINDAGVADVDGDGEFEIVVKWYPEDAFDSGVPGGPSAPTIFDFYELDGTPLWRLNMGLEMPSGAHFNQFMLYDMDEDGKAEFFIKTSDGTVSYKPVDGKFVMSAANMVSYIGDKSVIPGTNVHSDGHMDPATNEYVTVFNGATGEEISTIDYVNVIHDYEDWGYTSSGGVDSGNRSARFNIAIAYLPADQDDPNCTTTIPAVLLNRGYYDRTTVAAYTLRNGELNLEWNFVAPNGTEYAGKGNHNMSTGDMDNDGFDELVIGALAIDHDGTMLWVKNGKDGQDYQGHSDTIHLSAMNPNDPTQLYVFTPSEHAESTLNGTLSNAENGARINGTFAAPADIGRGVAANITPNPGFEYWINKPGNEGNADGAIYNFFGDVIATVPPTTFSTNWRLYWDGDLLSELGDGRNTGAGGTEQAIYKYDWINNNMERIEVFEGTHTNNSTKNNPSLTADLFGDWREEVMVPNTDNTELRIYMTTYETDYMIYSLMQDPVYRNAVANQNTAYNQPPHLGFYLGEDNKDVVLNMELTTPNIRYTTDPDTIEREFVPVTDADEVKAEYEEQLNGPNGSEIKEATGVNNADELLEFMANRVISDAAESGLGVVPSGQTMVLDIKLLITINGVKQEVTKDNFPDDGIDITVPYPAGITMENQGEYEFAISHLITMETKNKKVGEIESFSSLETGNRGITATEQGLVIHVSGVSPFAVAWQSKAEVPEPTPTPEGPTPTPESPTPTPEGPTPTPEGPTPTPEGPSPSPTDPGNNDGSDNGSDDNDDGDNNGEITVTVQNTDVTTTAVKTGDSMNYIAIVSVIVLVLAGAGVAVILKRRKESQ